MNDSDQEAARHGSLGRRVWNGLRELAASQYVWGSLATLGFYWSIPHLPVGRALAERYFCAHPVEYVQTALFFVGLFILVRKLLHLRTERAAVRRCLTHRDSAATQAHQADGAASGESSVAAGVCTACLSALTSAQQRTWMGERLRDIRQTLRSRWAAQNFGDQLKELHQRAADRMYDSYALLQTIHWAIPIMGFLGTVLGITMAIANLDVNQLDASLSAVTLNLAVAFDTTAVALCHSLVLVFLYLFVRRSEESVLASVAEFCRRELLPLVPAENRSSALVEAEAAAAHELIERTGELIESQTRLWSESIESLRERWTGTLADQQQTLTQALQEGTQQTLSRHAAELAELRGEFVAALQQLAQQREQSDAAHREQNAQFVRWWTDCMNQLSDALSTAQLAADQRAAKMLDEVTARVAEWESHLRDCMQTLDEHLRFLIRHEALLNRLLEEGQTVSSLEEKLTDNLQALRAAETFEQTMHSLSAAVHLLSSHARKRAA